MEGMGKALNLRHVDIDLVPHLVTESLILGSDPYAADDVGCEALSSPLDT